MTIYCKNVKTGMMILNGVLSLPEQCGGKITKAQGEIMTPNWPDKKYPPGTSCSWLITVEPDKVCGDRQTLSFTCFISRVCLTLDSRSSR